MQENEAPAAKETNVGEDPKQIASWSHLIKLLLIVVAVAAYGFWLQYRSTGNGTGTKELASHGTAIYTFLTLIFLEWGLVRFCLVGVRSHGVNFWSLTGGRWTSWKSVFVDSIIALLFWGTIESVIYGMNRLLPSGNVRSIANLAPQSAFEIVAWIATAITAGVCEEIVFRGYLQRQFVALSGNWIFAVLGQAAFFGMMHSYQGWKSVITITILGVLFGLLAVWRRNLRANMIAHAWIDIWNGWLGAVLTR